MLFIELPLKSGLDAGVYKMSKHFCLDRTLVQFKKVLNHTLYRIMEDSELCGDKYCREGKHMVRLRKT